MSRVSDLVGGSDCDSELEALRKGFGRVEVVNNCHGCYSMIVNAAEDDRGK